MTAALKIEALEAGYVRDLPILRRVDLGVERASLTVIIGPNGAGKSTLIKAVAGLVPVSGGRVLLDGKDITGIRPDQMAGLGLSYVPQTDNIFRHLSIRENLALVLRRVAPEAGRRDWRSFSPCSRCSRRRKRTVRRRCPAARDRCWRSPWRWRRARASY